MSLCLGERINLDMCTNIVDDIFNIIGRNILGGLRPAQLLFKDENDNLLLRMHKRFRLYFHKMDIENSKGEALGTIQKRFHPLRSIYYIQNKNDQTIMTIKGPLFLLPFVDRVFSILKDDDEVASVTKKWGGLLKERFTDADTFHSRLDLNLPLERRFLSLGQCF